MIGRLDLAARGAGERDLLLAFLAHHRRQLRDAIARLTDEEARQRLVPSLTTPLGLLKHAAFVETAWFVCQFTGLTRAEAGIPETAEESWILRESDTIAGLADAYDETARRADEVIARLDLDDVCHHPRLGTLSLRWVLVHCVRELAQHTGHAEILVEQLIASRPVSPPRPDE